MWMGSKKKCWPPASAFHRQRGVTSSSVITTFIYKKQLIKEKKTASSLIQCRLKICTNSLYHQKISYSFKTKCNTPFSSLFSHFFCNFSGFKPHFCKQRSSVRAEINSRTCPQAGSQWLRLLPTAEICFKNGSNPQVYKNEIPNWPTTETKWEYSYLEEPRNTCILLTGWSWA